MYLDTFSKRYLYVDTFQKYLEQICTTRPWFARKSYPPTFHRKLYWVLEFRNIACTPCMYNVHGLYMYQDWNACIIHLKIYYPTASSSTCCHLLFVILLLHTYLDRNVREEMLAQEIGSIPPRLKAKYVLSMMAAWGMTIARNQANNIKHLHSPYFSFERNYDRFLMYFFLFKILYLVSVFRYFFQKVS